MTPTGIYTKNLIDIGIYFKPYDGTSEKALGYVFTKNGIDVGTLLQKRTSVPSTNIGVYTQNLEDIGTIYEKRVEPLVTGLTVNIYDGYFGSTTNRNAGTEDVTYDNGKTAIYTYTGITNFRDLFYATNQQTITNNRYTIVWNGFFISDFTGTCTFGLTTDGGSYMWIGNNALYNNYTRANSTIAYGGHHSMSEVRTNTVSLTFGQLYPFRIMYGKVGGGSGIKLYYSKS